MRKSGFMWITLLALAGAFCGGESPEYPRRDITNIVVWSAGGGTDVCNRIISAEMSRILGVNINVINKPGGVGGSVGMADAYSRARDGYTLCGISESCVTAGVQGGWDKRMDVWDFFIVGGSPDLVSVSPSTPYETLRDLIEAAKSDPRAVRSAASASGSIHHLNLLVLNCKSQSDNIDSGQRRIPCQEPPVHQPVPKRILERCSNGLPVARRKLVWWSAHA
jgi:tripartite-type tricarboxylate transporter receptor subunit TctC